ncbi:hypothetical protein T440DRAFT_503007 [Plenodomus tracheiphilus IPT5]|uniref:DUF7587 domain-containing protein n=1 Tax=Plenodomus tracheiphilus IPT5 TaxID=1408161 RepID=A0A6A7AN56_9PLEO|nr:hypothetical protein T440DRAFT_503007 [Plenodomus tracheiphilus IPT5]
MVLDSLADRLGDLHLSQPKELLFCPKGDKTRAKQSFPNNPRFLYRITTPKSRGQTTRSWTKSMDATLGRPSMNTDIFALDDNCAGEMINHHLRWERSKTDNLVSWASSPLFLLVYIFHLHANSGNRSSFDDISFCIIDTTQFEAGTFIRDMVLMDLYSPYSTRLQEMKELRLGEYYFGEYLSQGALNIEDKCQIVSASAMIKNGLLDLQPELKCYARWPECPRPPWAKPVVRLRKTLDDEKTCIDIENPIRAITNIVRLFEPGWKLPIAASLASCSSTCESSLQSFLNIDFTDDERRNFHTSKTKVFAYNMPEVRHFNTILVSISKRNI